MRIAFIAAVLLLAACGRSADPGGDSTAGEKAMTAKAVSDVDAATAEAAAQPGPAAQR